MLSASWLRASFLLFACLLLAGTSSVSARIVFEQRPPEDPYQVLGVKPTASNDDIQKAYRKRAKETHPDKNSSPNANEEFRRITAAYEILGDPISRRKHDNRVRQDMARQRQAREQQRQRERMQRQREDNERKQRQKRHADMMVKAGATQSRVAKISTLEEFEQMMLDPSRKAYQKHCLIMFVANKNAEKKGLEEVYFPYPFAGEPNGPNAHQSTIQIAKASSLQGGGADLLNHHVRFNTATELTRLFRAKLHSNDPHIIFAQKGDAVGKFSIYNPRRHGDFKKWVESLLVIQATIANLHSLPVHLLVMRDGHIIYGRETLSVRAKYQRALTLQVGDRIMAYDERLDTFPGGVKVHDKTIIAKAKGALLMDTIVTSDNLYTVEAKRCYDLSVQCWDLSHSGGKMNRRCQLQPEFMHSICPHSCGVCSESIVSDITYLLLHKPIHTFPTFVQRFGSTRHLVEDIRNIITLRKNAAVAFFTLGLLLSFNILLFISMRSRNSQSKGIKKEKSEDGITQLFVDSFLLVSAVSICAALYWMVSTPLTKGTPFWLVELRRDLVSIASGSSAFSILVATGVFGGVYLRAQYIVDGDVNAEMLGFYTVYLLILITLLNTQFAHVWRFQKNAAVFIFVAGSCVGAGLVSAWRLSRPLRNKDLLLLINAVSICAALKWMVSTPFIRGAPFWLAAFHRDIVSVAKEDAVFYIILATGIVVGGVYFRSLLSTINGYMNVDQFMFYTATLLALIGAISTVLSLMMGSNTFMSLQFKHTWRYRKNAACAIFVVGSFAGVGLVSAWRLSKPMRKNMAFPAINLTVVAAVGCLVLSDQHFMTDVLHVLEMRKNAAFAFAVLGLMAGTLAHELSDRYRH